MKTILCSFALILLLFSCKKQGHCETWEYYDSCMILDGRADFSCNDTPKKQRKFCGDELIGVSTGSTKVLSEDSHSRTVRVFERQIN